MENQLTSSVLRIGNIIQFKPDLHGVSVPARVTGISGKNLTVRLGLEMEGIGFGSVEEYYALEGMTLTPGSLKLCGFNWTIAAQAYERNKFRYNLNERHDGGYSLTKWRMSHTIVERLDFVHQLQNIYFALEGMEIV